MAVKQERIGYYGKFTPTSLDTSAADKMRALAGLGETAANLSLAIAKPIAVRESAKQGAIAGAKAGRVDPATGELIAPPEQRKFGYGADAFNSAAESSYLGNVSFELDRSIKSAQEQFPDDIVGFNKMVEASRSGLLSKMPEQYKGSAQLVFDKLNAKAASTVAKAERDKDLAVVSAGIEQGSAVISDLVTNDAYAGNLEDVTAGLAEYSAVTLGLVETAGLAPDVAMERINNLKDRVVVQTKLGEVNRALLDPSKPTEDRAAAGREFVEAFRNNPDQTLSAEQNQELLSKLEAQVTGFEAKVKTDAATLTIAEQNTKADFKVRVNLKRGSAEDLTAEAFELQRKGIITADERANFEIEINKQTQETVKRLESNASVARKAGGKAAVGDKPVTQSAVNDFYDDVISPNLSTDDLNARSAQQAEVVSRTGYLAASNKTEILNSLNSQDPVQIEYAAGTIERMQEIPGVGASLFSKTEVAFASQVTRSSQYMPIEKAIEQANAIVRPGPVREAMVAERTAFIKDKKNSDVFSDAYPDEIKDAFEGFFDDIGGELAKDLLVKDYGQLVESYYLAGITDVNAAKAKAMSLVKANWSQGEFGLMKYSPESYYGLPVTGDTSYIRTQLQEDLNAGGLSVDAENVFLVSDDETARQASTGQPSYRVLYRDNDGILNAVSFLGAEGNKNDRFIPDVKAGQVQQEENIKRSVNLNPYGKGSGKSYSTLSSAQQDRMRQILGSSGSPFAFVGKGIAAAASLPSKLTKSNIKLVLDQVPYEFAADQISDAYRFVRDSVQEASRNYVASLQKTKGQGVASPDGSTKSKTEINEIDELIAEGKAVENNNSGIPASRSVTVYPTPTKKEEAAGITPEPYVMMQQNYSSAQVKKLFANANSKKKFTKGFKAAVNKVGQEEAEIMFINYFGKELLNALKGIGE